ncbi:MAG: UDP-N-acetylmuramoyl-L-alanine--D-glutamate ligase [bacterium]|nr:UDP-N-acetylmuramoyl-L-alanine--D-glutamate ligase [bacterium]
MELKGKKCIVVGAGKSGISAARFLASLGAGVILNDKADLAASPEMLKLEEEGVAIAGGGHLPELFSDRELIVLSPGVPASEGPICSLLIDAEKKGAEVISELELGYRFLDARLIAVTGTNGKSTVTTLLETVLAKAGKKVFAGGNLGTPLTEYLMDGERAEIAVLEVSSFQLERIKAFRPFISIMLNVTADHLDRYALMDDYVDAKKRIFMNQTAEDFAILNMDDERVAGFASSIKKARIIPFGVTRSQKGGVFINGDRIESDIEGLKGGMDIALFEKNGIHNIENAMAVFAAAMLCGLTEKEFCTGLEGFEPLPHRMQLVGEYMGIGFYDDSKATNVGAAVNSLENARGRVVLIAGGKDKGGSYEPLKEIVREKAKGVVLLGEAASTISSALAGSADIHFAEGMKEAVMQAFKIASKGDSIILSPACSSFDMYKNYMERGIAFQEAVRELMSEEKDVSGEDGEAALAG